MLKGAIQFNALPFANLEGDAKGRGDSRKVGILCAGVYGECRDSQNSRETIACHYVVGSIFLWPMSVSGDGPNSGLGDDDVYSGRTLRGSPVSSRPGGQEGFYR